MDWNNFFMSGSNQNFNYVPGGFPPGSGGTVYQNGQQNWQYYSAYNQNYISEPSSIQPMVPPLVTSSPYGGVFPQPSRDFQEGNLGSGMISSYPTGIDVNERISSPSDALASILSASSLTPTAGEFIPRSRNVQKMDKQNSALFEAAGNSVSVQHQDVSGAIATSNRGVSEIGVKESDFDSHGNSNNNSKTESSSLNCKSTSNWKDRDKKGASSASVINANEETSIGNDTMYFHSSNKKFDSVQNSISDKSDVTVHNDGKGKDSGIVAGSKHSRISSSKTFGAGHDNSLRKGSGRILQNRMGDNMKGSSARESKNQGRQRLLAEAATFYSSADSRRDGASSSNSQRKSFDWQAHRDGRNDTFSNTGRGYNSQMSRGNRAFQGYEKSEGNELQEKEKNFNEGRPSFNQNDGIQVERNDRRERKDLEERSDRREKFERDDKGDKNNKGEKNDRENRNDRGDINDKIDKNDREDRGERYNRGDRNDKGDKGDRSDRDRYEKGDKGDRNDRDRYEKGDRYDRSDRGDRYDRRERNTKGEQSDRNDRGKRWDRRDKNEREDNWGERGIRNERESRNNYGSRTVRQDGADWSDRNDAGRYQKTFYSSRFNSRNNDASPTGRELQSENNSFFQNRARRQFTNERQLESENNFSSRFENNSGRRYVPNEVSTFQNETTVLNKFENNNLTPDKTTSFYEDHKEKTTTGLNENTKSKFKLPQNEGPRLKNAYSGQTHRAADDAASQRERLSDQLTRGALECLVCCERVRQSDAVWSCNNCYHVLHLRCIRKWARSSRGECGWRCPACQNVSSEMPQEYRCFCGKMRDPEWNRQDLPHSCGEVCGRTRSARTPELGPCVHRCTLLCHPGPCPPCVAQVNRECGCGKTTQIVSCGSAQLLLCEALCEKLLNCKVHRCTKTCHWGACGDCEVVVEQECYCGKSSQEVPCAEETAKVKHYSCEEVCAHKLACNNHTCTLVCHDGECTQCELMPSRVTRCPCGKTALGEDCKRESCLDPIPTCGQPCEKQLPCGQPGNYHQCQVECHEGPCPQCPFTTFVKCRCGHMDREIECKELTTKADDARCEKRCSKKRACGKHKCNQTCCIDVDHQCPLPCNHTLSCGLHRCEELCHRGHCQPCWRTSFEELYCECGASVIFPPVACGTRRPACTQPCSRQHPCAHEALHRCHSDPTCPPCTVLMEKYCYGRHERRKAVPCHQTEFSCGMPCGLPLPCGRHTCILPCHKGPCVREGQPTCTQPCKITRSLCGHPCAAPCHDGHCPDTPCKETVRVTCECGHRSTTRPCYDQTKEYRRVMTALLASKMEDVQLGHSVDIADLGGPSARAESFKSLDCNDECKIIERNRRLAIGLQIRNPDLSSKLQPRYSDFMRQWGKKDPHFVAMVHDKLTELVQLAKQSKQKSRSYSFSSMNRDKRHLIHEYCEHFGCESQAYDPEPNRNVVATAQRDRAWLPSMSLLEVLQRESGQRKVPKPVTARAVDSKIKDSPSKQSTSEVKAGEGSSKEKEKEVEVDYFEWTS